MLLRTELGTETDCSVSEPSLPLMLSLVESSDVGVVLNSEFLLMSFSDLDAIKEDLEFGSDDFRDRLDDWDGDLDVIRLDLLLVCEPFLSLSTCSTLENTSLLQSEPMLLRFASMDRRVRESAARADSKLPFQLKRSSSPRMSDTPELEE